MTCERGYDNRYNRSYLNDDAGYPTEKAKTFLGVLKCVSFTVQLYIKKKRIAYIRCQNNIATYSGKRTRDVNKK